MWNVLVYFINLSLLLEVYKLLKFIIEIKELIMTLDG